MNEQAGAVASLVARLPEVYQPIYGYPELSGAASRETKDRLEDIKGVYEALSIRLGRPLRVLDLGCAQGFISLSLASMGASVVAVEMLPENVELCRKLGALNPELDINFVEGRIEEFVPTLESDSFDLVLLLSVIHHVAFHVSPEIAVSTVERIRSCAPVLLAELALADEPLYWAGALPADPVIIFGSAVFVRELRQSGTHLSEIKRPLYFVSDHYWYVVGELDMIEQVRHGGHRFAKRSFSSSRTYYLSADRVLKVLAIQGEDAEVNRGEVEREVAFLRGVDVENDANYPRVLGVDEDSCNIYLLREKIAGQLLADVIDAGQSFDYYLVIRDVLNECIRLEKRGLYHQDIRVWNVLVRDNGRFTLIDYGAISASKNDCFWPQNIYIAFLVFVKELLSAPRIVVEPIREISVTPYGFPGHLSYWVASLARRSLASWSFELMQADLEAAFLDPGAAAIEPESAREVLFKMLEEAVTTLARSHAELTASVEADRRVALECVEEEGRRISNLHHDLLGLSRDQSRLSDGQDELSSALSILRRGLEEQHEELRGFSIARREDSQALQRALDAFALRLDAMEGRLVRLEVQLGEHAMKNLTLHAELANEISEVKAKIFRKGFWARLLAR